MNGLTLGLMLLTSSILGAAIALIPGVNVFLLALILPWLAAAATAAPLSQEALSLTVGAALGASLITSAIPILLIAPSDSISLLLQPEARRARRLGRAPTAVLDMACGVALAALSVSLLSLSPLAAPLKCIPRAIMPHRAWMALSCVVFIALSHRPDERPIGESRKKRLSVRWGPFLREQLCLFLGIGLGVVACNNGSPLGPLPAIRHLLPLALGLFGGARCMSVAFANESIVPQGYERSRLNWPGRLMAAGLGMVPGTVGAFIQCQAGGIAALFADSPRKPNGHAFFIATGATRASFQISGALLMPLLCSQQLPLCTDPVSTSHRSPPPIAPMAILLGSLFGIAVGLTLLPRLIHGTIRLLEKRGSAPLAVAGILFMTTLCLVLCGANGLLLFLIATSLGLLPLLYGFSTRLLLPAIIVPLALFA